ncbi:MAG: hypothetical protein HPY78_03385 [Brevinematales bacterium]|nr:hypothetical protein [Brevinematales bacterium]
MEEKKDVTSGVKKELYELRELVAKKNMPLWQEAAFYRFSGWLSTKMVDKKEFESALNRFYNGYGGK